MIERLKMAWRVLCGNAEEPINGGHRYGIVIGDSCYMADSYKIDPYSGDPEVLESKTCAPATSLRSSGQRI